jgi:hypothetical protein
MYISKDHFTNSNMKKWFIKRWKRKTVQVIFNLLFVQMKNDKEQVYYSYLIREALLRSIELLLLRFIHLHICPIILLYTNCLSKVSTTLFSRFICIISDLCTFVKAVCYQETNFQYWKSFRRIKLDDIRSRVFWKFVQDVNFCARTWPLALSIPSVICCTQIQLKPKDTAPCI